jgi:hypothetical protein
MLAHTKRHQLLPPTLDARAKQKAGAGGPQFDNPDGPTVPRGAGGWGWPQAPLALSLSMWLTERKAGCHFGNEIV